MLARRRFTDEELEQIANKDWKVTPIFSSDEKFAAQAANLTGPRTVEGKKRSLQNLRVGKNKGEGPPMSHGGYVKRILDQDEQDLYESRRGTYLKDYDINGSADELLLHMILIDEVMYYRMLRRQFENPSLDIDRPLNECSARLNKNLDSLGALRRQRLKQDEKLTAISIATIAQQFSKELMAGDIQAQLAKEMEEEKRFLEEKKKREREAMTVEADYEDINPDDSLESRQ